MSEDQSSNERSPLIPDPERARLQGNGTFGIRDEIQRDPGGSSAVWVEDGEGIENSDEETISEDTYHCHTEFKNSRIDYRARRTLIAASVLCLAFMLAEIVGGLLAGSLAIITDAAHLLTDFASFLISLFSLYVASRPPSKRMSFGWHRAEVLGAFVSVLLIWVVTGVLVYMAVQRIVNKEYEIDAEVMLITAALGVLVNILMGLLLHFGGGGHGHSHGGGGGHGHSHETGDKKAAKSQNINVRAALIHVIGDFVQSIGVFVAAALIFFKPEWGIADPICTFIFSILVLITTIAVMRDALTVLMEGKPHSIDFNEVIQALEGVNGVRKAEEDVISEYSMSTKFDFDTQKSKICDEFWVHDLRIWSLTMDKVAISVHLAIDPDASSQWVLKATTAVLRKRYGVHESTIQIEGFSESMLDCGQCVQPE